MRKHRHVWVKVSEVSAQCSECGQYQAALYAANPAVATAERAIVEAADEWRDNPRAGIVQLTAVVDAWRKLKGKG